MKSTTLFFFAAFVLCLVSCSNNEESEQAVTTEPATTQTETSLPAGGNADPAAPSSGFSEQQLTAPYNPGLQQTPQGGVVIPPTPGYNPAQPQQQTMTINPGQKTVTAPGMNPPHGEPNHRCDIQVGAPLNSPPGNAGAPQVTPMPANPGAPSTTTTTTSPKQTIQMDPSLSFLSPSGSPSPSPTLNPSTPSEPTPEGMNPAHGEPGHRCDIAVGAPLNSPPGKVSEPGEPMEIKMGEPEQPK